MLINVVFNSICLALATGAEPVVRLATSPLFRHIRDLIRCVAAQPRTPSSLYCKQSCSAPSEIRGSLFALKNLLHYCTRDFGSRNWARTSDPLINSQMLCQLSYGRISLLYGRIFVFKKRNNPAAFYSPGQSPAKYHRRN